MIDRTNLIHTIITDFINWTLGGFDGKLCALIAFILLDLITEFLVSCICKDKPMKLSLKWILQKIMIFIIIIMANIIDMQILQNEINFRSLTIAFYLVLEASSIFKNAKMIDVKIPSKLKELIKNWINGNV